MDQTPFSSQAAFVFILSQVLLEEDKHLSSKPITDKNQSTREKGNKLFSRNFYRAKKAGHVVRLKVLREFQQLQIYQSPY